MATILRSTIVALLLIAGPACAAERGDRPNVLLIMVDDLNDWVGAMGGHPQAVTPNLDRLASRGVLFANAHAPAPLCNPSRTSMLTGLLPSTTGVYCNKGQFRDHPDFGDTVTLPEYFREHGYATWSGGKIYHKSRGERSDPRSWDEQYSLAIGTPKPPVERRFLHGLRGRFSTGYFNTALDWGPIDQPKEATGDWKTASGAARLLAEEHDKPFFLACGIFRPHLTHYAPQEFFDLYPDASAIETPAYLSNDTDDLPATGKRLSRGDFLLLRDAGVWSDALRGYLACVSFADACIGRVLDALDRGPHRDNTVVVLAGDHGWHLGEKDHWSKFTLWERASKTPLVIVAPDADRPGSRRDDPAGLVDVYPTLVDLCGLPERKGLEGRSLAPLVRDGAAVRDEPVLVTHWRANHAVQDRRYRYIRYRDGGEELYDHAEDPNEWRNLASDPTLAAVKDRLAQSLPARDAEHFQPEAPENF